jgi:hypothetical protein
MKNIRLIHFYLGIFFAPLIIFFAFTGTLQVFKLHESYRETPGTPGDWIAWLGNVHKESAWLTPRVSQPRPPSAMSPKPPSTPPFRPMKWFAAAMGVALIASSLLGLYMAFSVPSRRRQALMALVAGIVIPPVLLFAF